MLYFLYILYCLEIGLFLLIYPWHSIWYKNFLLYEYPTLKLIAFNNFVRGAVSGLGAVNVALGLWELWHLRHRSRKSPIG